MKPGRKSLEMVPQFCGCGDHAWQEVGKGAVALVSSDDGWAFCRKWFISANGYIVRTERTGRRTKSLYLHKELMVSDSIMDHKNGNKTDCRRGNLRPCSKQENGRNRKPTYGPRPKGVSRQRSGNWVARITIERGRTVCLGTFGTIEAAAAAYDEAAMVAHGDFARLNVGG